MTKGVKLFGSCYFLLYIVYEFRGIVPQLFHPQKLRKMTKNQIYQMHRKLNKRQIDITQWWDFITGAPEDILREVVETSVDAQRRLLAYKSSPLYLNKIRKYCNYHGYSDIEAFEVVRVISPVCVEIRALDTVQTVVPSEFYPGGFSGHYADNNNQKYEYSVNESNPVAKIRLSKKGWGLGQYRMSDYPVKFYDYNF